IRTQLVQPFARSTIAADLDVEDDAPLAQEPGLFTFANTTSFHRQIFPNATLSFGFSASAMHWVPPHRVPLVWGRCSRDWYGAELALERLAWVRRANLAPVLLGHRERTLLE